MSGGAGYVLDLDPEHVNPELVDLRPLRAEDELVVRDLLERHQKWTDSPIAGRLLADWETARASFTPSCPAPTSACSTCARRLPQRASTPTSPRSGRTPCSQRIRRPPAADLRGTSPFLRTRDPTCPRVDPCRSASAAGIGGLQAVAGHRAPAPGRPLHGLRDPVLPSADARSETSSPSGTTSSGAGSGARPSTASTRRTTSPSSPAAVPRPCETGASSGSTSPPSRSSRSRRDRRPAWANGSSARRRPNGSRARQSRSRLRARRPRRRAAADRAGHTVAVYERADQTAGCCATASPSSRWRSRSSTGGSPR